MRADFGKVVIAVFASAKVVLPEEERYQHVERAKLSNLQARLRLMACFCSN